MTLDLPAIRARAEAATPGPWTTNEYKGELFVVAGGVCLWDAHGDLRWGSYVSEGVRGDANAAFICHAREDIPALLAEVERLTRNLEYASAECCDLSAYRQLVREEHPAEVAALTAEVERLREQLPRVVRWVVKDLAPRATEQDIEQLVAEALEAPRG